MPPRRAFLRTAAGLAAAPLLEPLFRIDEAFAAELDVLSGSGRLEPGPQLREQYLLDPDVIYFNHGSIGTMPRAVADARRRYVETCERNPWRYMWSGDWDPPRELVRAKASRYLGCDPNEMAITHNTTEGFNVLAHGLPLGPGDEVVFSSLNHPGASQEGFDFMEATGAVGWNALGYLTLARIQLARDEPAPDIERTLAAYEAVIERTGMRVLEEGLREMRARVGP